MAISARCCAVILATLIGSARAMAAPACPPLDTTDTLPAPELSQKIYVATRLYDTVERYFAHAEALPDAYDFDAEYKRFVTEAIAARTRVAFDLAAMRLLGSLRNGHTSFTDTTLACEPELPFRAEKLGNDWVITRSQLDNVPPGAVIRQIDDQPFETWASARLPLVRRSNDTESESQLFSTGLIWPVRFSLTLADGRSVRVDRVQALKTPWKGLYTQPEGVRVSMLQGGIVRIEIPSFDDPKFEAAAVAAVKAHASAPAILFDVRGNGGGSTPIDLIHTVLEHPVRDMIDATPAHFGTIEAWAEADVPTFPRAMLRTGGEPLEPDHPVFHGRAYFLADRHCASACEDFITTMHNAHRGVIMGETTYGSTGQPYFVSFPDLGMRFRVSTRREYFPDFTPFEGVGVHPDVPLPTTVASLRSGHDEVLAQALTRIERNR
ncbi:S41 family peptidase [Tanticharoenia sakaeratensis]|uniref:Peptidase, S41 family protein n=1 Tax=Tanticharoenia sakaeratensis NBRC 103193 TaxID=1231623 RepID=A0A0D6ML81_9PROT|nr:S41 family peptidase [Tanticharoenia sakaeratensis]GAN54215.1 peptidase, S41 family protein [Tanticharoenia sakaeratensis NBRC 103193]GBQ19261.1 peptidase S41 [Tanticharoenia sakaeratensis NBRC 103193]